MVSQKRNCNGCRALELRGANKGAWCSLNHPVKSGKQYLAVTLEYVPQEPCEKPTTYEKYFQLRTDLNKSSDQCP